MNLFQHFMYVIIVTFFFNFNFDQIHQTIHKSLRSFFFLFNGIRLLITLCWSSVICWCSVISSRWLFRSSFFFLLLIFFRLLLLHLLLLLLYIFSFLFVLLLLLFFFFLHLLLLFHLHLILFIFLLHHLLIIGAVFEVWITSHVACTIATEFTSLTLELLFTCLLSTWHFGNLFFIFLMMNPVSIKCSFL